MPRPSDPHAKIDLLRAAEAIFIEHGLEKARVEDITSRAGRSKGSFYLHFATKEDAFRQIVEAMLAGLACCIDADPPEAPAKGGQELAALFDHLLDRDLETFGFLWQNRRVARLLLSGGGSATFGYLIDEFAERARARVKETLLWGAAAGLYRPDLDSEVASLFIAGAYDRVARHMVRLDKKPDLRGWLRQLQALVLRGIGTPAVVTMIDSVVRKEAAPLATKKTARVLGGNLPGAKVSHTAAPPSGTRARKPVRASSAF